MLNIVVKKIDEIDHVLFKGGSPSCECCCVINEEEIRDPTYEELIRSCGRTCGRQFDPPPSYSSAFWPTLPCLGLSSGSGFLGSSWTGASQAFRARHKVVPACLRFHYRLVNYETSAEGTVIREGSLGGEAAKDPKEAIESWLPYREDKPNLFVGESCGLYIYVVEFFAWRSTCTRSEFMAGLGGAQYTNPEKTECGSYYLYDVDFYAVGGPAGPYFVWPPPEFLEDGWMAI